jgi:hypothetical protein
LNELAELARTCAPVWVFLVCGVDGVVGLPVEELRSIVKTGTGGVAWIRVSRARNAMYRISGSIGELPRAIPRGVQAFVSAVG